MPPASTSVEEVYRLLGLAEAAPGGAFGLFVPGRIELIGKHTDYAGGSSLTMATTAGFHVVARALPEPVMRLRCPSRGLEGQLPLEPGVQASVWLGYPASVIRRVLGNIPSSRSAGGVEIRFESTLPVAAGMSSSSAFMVSVFLAWGHAAGWIRDPLLQEAIRSQQDLADYLACIENGRDFHGLKGTLGVGTAGGSQDHTAIILGREGHIQRFRYVGSAREGVWPWPPGVVPLVLTSGVEAQKTGGAKQRYNAASALASNLLETWLATGGRPVPAVGHLTEEELDSLEESVADQEYQRLQAFRNEQRLVEAASTALDAGDITAMAYAVNASQSGAELLLENQISETRFLCRAAREAGALAATSFGAGFGGAVWALVPTESAEAIAEQALGAYHSAFNQVGAFRVERPGPGAFFLDGRALIPD